MVAMKMIQIRIALLQSENKKPFLHEAKLNIYRRLPKIDTPKIDTFYQISRNFEKN